MLNCLYFRLIYPYRGTVLQSNQLQPDIPILNLISEGVASRTAGDHPPVGGKEEVVLLCYCI